MTICAICTYARSSDRDWPALMLSRLAATLFWFNPLVWLLEREVVQQAEEAADCEAAERVEPVVYAETLLNWAQSNSMVPANSIAPSAQAAKPGKRSAAGTFGAACCPGLRGFPRVAVRPGFAASGADAPDRHVLVVAVEHRPTRGDERDQLGVDVPMARLALERLGPGLGLPAGERSAL